MRWQRRARAGVRQQRESASSCCHRTTMMSWWTGKRAPRRGAPLFLPAQTLRWRHALVNGRVRLSGATLCNPACDGVGTPASAAGPGHKSTLSCRTFITSRRVLTGRCAPRSPSWLRPTSTARSKRSRTRCSRSTPRAALLSSLQQRWGRRVQQTQRSRRRRARRSSLSACLCLRPCARRPRQKASRC